MIINEPDMYAGLGFLRRHSHLTALWYCLVRSKLLNWLVNGKCTIDSFGLPHESKRRPPHKSQTSVGSSGPQTFLSHPTHPWRITRVAPAIVCSFLSAAATVLGNTTLLRTRRPSLPSRRASKNFWRVCVLQFVSHCKHVVNKNLNKNLNKNSNKIQTTMQKQIKQ